MKIAIYGETFNPVHNGHIHLLTECSKIYSFDKILLIPTNLPPHKKAQKLASNEDRFDMLKLAIEGENCFEISDIEYKLGEKSYTIYTINMLKKQYENAEFYLIIGSDMLRMFDKWYRYEEILNCTKLVVGARRDAEYNELFAMKDSFGELSSQIEIVKINALDVSSTQIRENIKLCKDIDGLVNHKVKEYILKKGLYK